MFSDSEFLFSETQKNLPLEEQLKLLLDELELVENTAFSKFGPPLDQVRNLWSQSLLRHTY